MSDHDPLHPASPEEAAMSDIEQAVYEALGAASVCWTDEGVFDSEQAKAIAEDLMYRIVQEVEARADERERLRAAVSPMGDWREQAKAAIEEALGHGYSSLDNFLNALIDAVEPIIVREMWKTGTPQQVREVIEAEVRADERERILSELEGPARESEAMYAHAEAVAARLVEVICRMDEEAEWYTPGSLEQARHQRDAARAEVAALRKQEWAEPYRRDVLADLRVAVQFIEMVDEYNGELIYRDAVLALIEEAERA